MDISDETLTPVAVILDEDLGLDEKGRRKGSGIAIASIAGTLSQRERKPSNANDVIVGSIYHAQVVAPARYPSQVAVKPVVPVALPSIITNARDGYVSTSIIGHYNHNTDDEDVKVQNNNNTHCGTALAHHHQVSSKQHIPKQAVVMVQSKDISYPLYDPKTGTYSFIIMPTRVEKRRSHVYNSIPRVFQPQHPAVVPATLISEASNHIIEPVVTSPSPPSPLIVAATIASPAPSASAVINDTNTTKDLNTVSNAVSVIQKGTINAPSPSNPPAKVKSSPESKGSAAPAIIDPAANAKDLKQSKALKAKPSTPSTSAKLSTITKKEVKETTITPSASKTTKAAAESQSKSTKTVASPSAPSSKLPTYIAMDGTVHTVSKKLITWDPAARAKSSKPKSNVAGTSITKSDTTTTKGALNTNNTKAAADPKAKVNVGGENGKKATGNKATAAATEDWPLPSANHSASNMDLLVNTSNMQKSVTITVSSAPASTPSKIKTKHKDSTSRKRPYSASAKNNINAGGVSHDVCNATPSHKYKSSSRGDAGGAMDTIPIDNMMDDDDDSQIKLQQPTYTINTASKGKEAKTRKGQTKRSGVVTVDNDINDDNDGQHTQRDAKRPRKDGDFSGAGNVQDPLFSNYVIIRDVHKNITIFKCKEVGCEYQSKTRGPIVSHLASHKSAKPYLCRFPGCDFKATQMGNRNMHERIHSGLKPHKCHYANCSYESSKGSNLTAHIQRVHLVNEYSDANVDIEGEGPEGASVTSEEIVSPTDVVI